MKLMKTLLATAMLAPLMSQAAVDGPLSTGSSTGSLLVNATVNSVIAVKHLDDISFGTLTPGINVASTDTLVQNESFCVYSNDPGYEFELTTTGGIAGAFSMTGTKGGFLPYTVAVTVVDGTPVLDAPGIYTDVPVTSNLAPATYQGTFYYSQAYGDTECSDGTTGTITDNVKLSFSLSGSDVFMATPDSYTDSVLVTARTPLPPLLG